jgi:hypothetical protein
MKPGDTALNRENLMDEDTVLSVCAGLVVIDRRTGMRLVHYTTQDYLEQILPQRSPDAAMQITMTCLTYLSFSLLHPDYADKSFSKYATWYWMAHAPDTSIRPSISPSITGCTEWEKPQIHRSSRDLLTSPVWMTAAFNLDKICRHLVDILSGDPDRNNDILVVVARLVLFLNYPHSSQKRFLAFAENDAQVLLNLLQTVSPAGP